MKPERDAGSPPFHVKQLADGLDRIGLAPDRSRDAKLVRFAQLLATRGMEIGAIARSDRDRILDRHVLDSLRALPMFRDTDRVAYDFGSGAGLPGIPLAIALPSCGFALVESRHWRAAFLEMVVAELDLNARVERARVESMGAPADVVTSRAFAPLRRAWELARGVLKPDGRLVFYAGAGMKDPQGAAREVSGSDATVEVVPDLLERGGPLVIMTRSA